MVNVRVKQMNLILSDSISTASGFASFYISHLGFYGVAALTIALTL